MYNQILPKAIWRKEQELVEHVGNTGTSCSFDQQQKEQGQQMTGTQIVKSIKFLLSPTNFNSL